MFARELEFSQSPLIFDRVNDAAHSIETYSVLRSGQTLRVGPVFPEVAETRRLTNSFARGITGAIRLCQEEQRDPEGAVEKSSRSERKEQEEKGGGCKKGTACSTGCLENVS